MEPDVDPTSELPVTPDQAEPLPAPVRPETLVACRPEVEAALSTVAIRNGLRNNYSTLLRETVFPFPAPGLDLKAIRHHQKLLDSQNARSLLELIWPQRSSPSHLPVR